MFLSISKATKTLKVTYFARYKIYLVVDYYTLDKVLSKIKKISTEKLDDTRILIDTDDKLPHDITFKNAVKLRTWVIKDVDKFYLQVFLEEAPYDE